MIGRETQRRASGEAALPALLSAVVWIGGFEVAPPIHLLAHAAGGPAHCHGTACHEHDDPDADGLVADGHGAGSLEHRDVAVAIAPPAVVAWPAQVVGLAPAHLAPAEAVTASPPRDVRARGPPLDASSRRFSAPGTASAAPEAGRECVQFRTPSQGRELA